MNRSQMEERLSTLYRLHYHAVLAYCIRRIGPDEADDVTAEVFLVAWKRMHEIDWATVRPWLYGVARGVLANRWRTLRRSHRLSRKVAALASDPGETPETYVIRRDQDHAVVQAVKRLRKADQEILMLAAWEELTAPEIAKALSISTPAAEQRLHRAKLRLAKVLAPVSGDPEVPPRAARERGGR